MSQLTDLIRKKYPDAYKDMSDEDLEKAVLDKYPQYKSLAAPSTDNTTTDDTTSPTKEVTPTITKSDNTKPDVTKSEDKGGFFSNLYHKLTDPLTEAPSRFADTVATAMTEPHENENPIMTAIKGFSAGATQGLGKIASGLTSPASLGTLALSGGSSLLADSAPEIASALNIGSKVASTPFIAHGAVQTLNPNSTLGERGQGLAEMAGGLGAMLHSPDSIPESESQSSIKFPISQESPSNVAPSPELVPPGSEGSFNNQFSNQVSGTNPEDNLFQNAANKFGMAQPLPSPSVKATFLGLQPDAEGGQPTPLFNIEGGPSDGSTVSGDTLQKMGIEVPEVPSDAQPVKGSDLRDLFIKKQQTDRSQANDTTPEFGSVAKSAKPRFKLDSESGSFIPIDESGKQTGPAIIPGKVVDPKLIEQSKYTAPTTDSKGPSILSEILNTPRALQIGNLHLSAPLRQGLPLITTKPWWTSWGDMFKAFGSQEATDLIDQRIKSNPNFKPVTLPNGESGPSYAEQSGLSLTNDLNKREEVLGSKWLENIPGYKASNRAFKTYLNVLRSDSFNSLVDDATKSGLNPRSDMPLSQEIASFINNATGRGDLGALEKHADLLNSALFAPRKIAGNIQMLNPANYVMGNPFVRKQYLKALLSTAGAWTTFAGLAKAGGASVSLDPNNSDFGKIKIGNTRIDPAGGFQQYLVAAHRLLSGQKTSSTTDKTYNLGSRYGLPTRKDIVEQFGANKLNTPFRFAYDLLNASKGQPFNVTDQTARMFIPIVAQDIVELAKEDPRLLPAAIPNMFGMGNQTYDNRGKNNTILPSQFSMNIR